MIDRVASFANSIEGSPTFACGGGLATDDNGAAAGRDAHDCSLLALQTDTPMMTPTTSSAMTKISISFVFEIIFNKGTSDVAYLVWPVATHNS